MEDNVAARSSRPPSIATSVIADPLDLAEQVRGDHDRDAEVGADPVDQRQHRVAADRVQAVGRLVEQDQPRVVDEGLGQLHALLHAGGEAADLPVALLVQTDVAQRVRGVFRRGGRRQAADIRPRCMTNSVAVTSGGRQSCSGM